MSWKGGGQNVRLEKNPANQLGPDPSVCELGFSVVAADHLGAQPWARWAAEGRSVLRSISHVCHRYGNGEQNQRCYLLSYFLFLAYLFVL